MRGIKPALGCFKNNVSWLFFFFILIVELAGNYFVLVER
jgi:hypothetical protein